MDKKKSIQPNNRLFELLVGYACNANCRFCSIDEHKRGIQGTTQQHISSIVKARKDGCVYLGIGGGEPTLRDDLALLLKAGKDIGYHVVRIETNGIRLAYFEYCNELVAAGLDFVKLSVHGHTPEIHDYLTRVDGSFDKILKAIDNLQRLKIRIELNIVVNRYNCKYLTEMARVFVNKGIGSFCFIYPQYSGQMMSNSMQLGISLCEVIPYIRSAVGVLKKFDVDKIAIFNVPPCFFSDPETVSIYLGSLHMSVQGPDFFIGDADINMRQGMSKVEACGMCSLGKKCSGLFNSYLDVFKGNQVVPLRVRGKNIRNQSSV